MAQRTVTAFKATKNTRFADSTTGEISEADSRDMFEDTADSFLNISDHFIDEDSFASNSATKVPSQQSVKAYVDAATGGGLTLASGTYTPTATGNINVAAVTAYPCQYLRVGDTVTVSGGIDIDPTAASAFTKISLTLPVTTGDFTAGTQAAGTIAAGVGFGYGLISPNVGDQTVQISVYPTSTDSKYFSFIFSFRVQP